MSVPDSRDHLEEDISIHIFTVSASLVGVCLTVIGIVRIVIGVKNINTIADDLLAVDAFIFLCSCLLSYWALRTRSKKRMHQVEHLADALFILGLVLMVTVCGLIVYVLI
jgi:hypothetical protein